MIIIGHRGARGLAPENTLAAIKKGLSYHVDEIEIDIRITYDGVPILSHDSSLMADNTGMQISRHTYADLKKFKPDVATLSEALKLTDGRTRLYIEVKHGEPTIPVVTAIKNYIGLSRHTPELLLGSKSQRVLMALHRQLPGIPTIVIEPWSGLRAVYRARKLGTRRISMRSWWLYRKFLENLAIRGYKITPYTMNKPEKVAKWQDCIYGVVTDYPDRFIGVRSDNK
jgi:glycerophosphoryl diester phosphodiesterase